MRRWGQRDVGMLYAEVNEGRRLWLDTKSINTMMPWMCTHGLFTSIPMYPRSGLISGARTRAATTRLEMPSTPTCGLQSLTQEMVHPATAFAQALTGYGCPATRCSCSARCPSCHICRCSFYAGRPGLGGIPLLHVNHSGRPVYRPDSREPGNEVPHHPHISAAETSPAPLRGGPPPPVLITLLLSSANSTEESTCLHLLLSKSYPLASTLSASIDDSAASYIHPLIFPIPSPIFDRRRLTMCFITAREGCEGLGIMPAPGRVAMSSTLIFNMDCARCLRARGDSDGGEAVPRGGLVKVTPGELGERAPLLQLPLLAGVELSERNCSWLVARTSWTFAAQSSKPYILCSNNLNVNG